MKYFKNMLISFLFKLKFILIIIIAFETFGQQYNFIYYNRSEDKIGNQVWDIYQDSKGYMWFATSAGLSRYNGWKYDVYNQESGLIESFAFSVREDKKGNFWAGGPGGISYIKWNEDRNQLPQIQNNILGKFKDFYRVFVDSYGRVWAYNFATVSDIYFIEKDSIYNFSEKFRFRNQRVIFINEYEDAVYFLTTDGGIYKFFLNEITELQLEDIPAEFKPRMFFFNGIGELVICGAGGVAVVSSEDSYQSHNLKWILKKSSMFALESKKGGYWIATERDGLFKVENGTVKNITDKNGLITNNLYTLFEDKEGVLWIGAALHGICKLPNLRLTNFGKKEGFLQEAISSITILNNTIYCSTEDGIFTFNEPVFRRFEIVANKDASVSSKFFYHIIPYYGDSWLLGGSNGLYLLRANGLIEHIGIKGMWVQSLLKDVGEQIWIGTNNGLFKLQADGVIVHQDINYQELNILAIAEIKSQDLYLATTDGVVILENWTNNDGIKQVRKLTTSDGLLSNMILDLAVSSAEEIIIGTAKGINVINANEMYGIDKGLSNQFVIDLFEDRKGRLWAGTYNGVSILEKKADRYTVTKQYYKKDGLISNEFTRNNNIIEDHLGRIWIGSFGGLTVYDPSEDDNLFISTPCYISSVMVNDSTYSPKFHTDHKFAHTENKISFSFEGLSFMDERMVQFQYYLEPLETEWSKTTNTPTAFYGYLNPGSYIFHVRAISSLGGLSNQQIYRFEILSPFWSTWWFTLLLLSFFGVLIYIGYLYRTQKIRKRNIILQNIVDEKTHQLTETNVKLEIQYNDLLEAQKKLVEKEKLEEAFKEIEKLKNRLSIENIYLREKQTTVHEVGSLVGNSECIKKIRKLILEVAPTDSTVLITGETGTGKTLVGEAIHQLSKRGERTLIAVNCAAIPDGLVESELFGHEKGAFTGAHTRRLGKFEVADGSTILLDEIGDMDLHIQSKILTFLQERRFNRIGGNEFISVDVRIIAATNYDLELLVAERKFRKDLFHRLKVFCINIPPLREHTEDIEILTKFFADRFSKLMNKNITSISKSALEELMHYQFPGNVRELENIIQRAVIVCKTNVITDEEIVLSHFPGELNKEFSNLETVLSLEEMERKYISAVLRQTKGKISGKNGAAELLGMHPNTLRSRLEKLNINYHR